MVRHQDVERPERFLGARDEPLGLAVDTEVRAQHDAGAARLGERRARGRFVAPVGDPDSGAEPRHQDRGVLADATARAGDESACGRRVSARRRSYPPPG